MPDKEQPYKVKPRVTDPNVFDLQTHFMNARGQVEGTNTYRLHYKDGTQYFERPVGSGNLFFSNNEEAGRVEAVKDAKNRNVGKKFDFAAAHISYAKPLSGTEQITADLAAARASEAAARAELEAIRKELAAKDGAKPAHMVDKSPRGIMAEALDPQAQKDKAHEEALKKPSPTAPGGQNPGGQAPVAGTKEVPKMPGQ